MTWFAIVLSVLVYHLIECALITLEHGMFALLSKSQRVDGKEMVRPNGWLLLKLLAGFATACKYALSVIFMLIAVTFNPSLILALVVGYLIGGYLCCELKMNQQLLGDRFLESSTYGLSSFKWWIRHSPHEHYVVVMGVLTFPTALFTGYALIHNSCYYLHPGQHSPSNVIDTHQPGGRISNRAAPFVGGWFADWCAFENEPTNKLSVQQSLGVFYGFLAVTAAIMLLAKRYKAVFNFLRKEVVKGRSLTNGEVIMAGGVGCLLIFNFAFWYNRYTFMIMNGELYLGWLKGTDRQPWFFATQVSGRLLDVSLGLLMIPVAKNTVLQQLLGISYDGAITFHKTMGWIFVMITIAHVGVYMKSAHLDEVKGGQSLFSHMFNCPDKNLQATGIKQSAWGQGSWKPVMGSYGTLFMIPPILLAFPVVRRQFYNIFYFSHLFLHVSIVFLWLHAPSDFYYMLPAIGKY